MSNLIKKGLESCSLFSDLKPNQLRRLERNSRLLHYQARDLVFSQSQPASGLYLVTEGKVTLLLRLTNGKKRMLNIVGPGGTLGKESLFSAKEYSVSARSLEETTLICMSREEIDWLLERNLLKGNSQFYANLAQELSGEIRAAWRKLAEDSHLGSRGKVARALLRMRNEHGQTDEGYLTVELRAYELAELVGAHRRTSSKRLLEFENRGWIKVNREKSKWKIKILDQQSLENLTDSYLIEEINKV